jgi:hypothetical protein
MESDRAISLLRERLEELAALPLKYGTPEYRLWRQKTDLTLKRIFGEDHDLVKQLEEIHFSYAVDDPSVELRAFQSGKDQVQALLEGSIYQLEELSEPVEFMQDAVIDQELWEHVGHLVEQEQWGQVASQTAIFVESKIRQWAGRPPTEVGEALMTAVLGANGVFVLGQTAGEQQGWHRLGMGFAMALRNVDTHRIQQRDDDKRYAMGVLGAGSLLLTQVRYEHGNRFRA